MNVLNSGMLMETGNENHNVTITANRIWKAILHLANVA